MSKPPKPLKLEAEPIWVETNALAEYLHGKLHDMPDDEQWDTTAKLRSSIVNLLFEIGEALGTATPGANEYEWGAARKSAAALKTMYRYAGRQKFIELEPEIMVRLDALIAAIDERVVAAYAQTAAKDQEDLDYWREKYRLSLGGEHERQP